MFLRKSVKVSGEMIGGWADSDTMRKAISDVYEKYDYLMDPHTAVAYAVYDNLRRSGKVTRHTHTVIISTAHPYKFLVLFLRHLALRQRKILMIHCDPSRNIPGFRFLRSWENWKTGRNALRM